MTSALAGQHLPHAVMTAVENSLGGALAVATRAGGAPGALLAHLAKTAFVSGMDLGLLTGSVVAIAGCLLVLAWLPARPGAAPAPGRRSGRPAPRP